MYGIVESGISGESSRSLTIVNAPPLPKCDVIVRKTTINSATLEDHPNYNEDKQANVKSWKSSVSLRREAIHTVKSEFGVYRKSYNAS
jgi:hypothetical protein